MATNRETLLKFINAQAQKVQDDISMQGYKRNSPYVDRPQNVIKGQPGQPTPITMQGVDKTLVGRDEYGNEKIMHPGEEYEFPGSEVTETPIAQAGGDTYKFAPVPITHGDYYDVNLDKAQQGVQVKDVIPHGRLFDTNKDEIKANKRNLAHEQFDFYKNWMKSPQYNRMVNNSTRGTEGLFLRQGRTENIKHQKISFENKQPKGEENTGANSDSDTGLITVFPFGVNSDIQGRVGNQFEGMITHEVSHSSDRPYFWPEIVKGQGHNPYDYHEGKEWARLIPQKDINLMQSYSKGNKAYQYLFNKSSLKNKELDAEREWHNYVSDPTETRARLNDIRYNAKKYGIYDPFTQKATPETIEKIKELTRKAGDFDPFEQLKSVYDDDQILNLLNSVSQNDQHDDNTNVDVAKYGGEQKQYQIGGAVDLDAPVYKQYQQLTGKSWKTARAQGLTNGSKEQNIALIQKLIQERNQPVAVQPEIVPSSGPATVSEQPANYSADDEQRRQWAKHVVEVANQYIKKGHSFSLNPHTPYIDVPEDIKKAAVARGEEPNACIGGVCTVLHEAGVIPTVDWSNTHFAEKAKDYGFQNNGWGVKGIANLEPGDVLQYMNHKNDQGHYYPGHATIYIGNDKDGNYQFFDNYWGEVRTRSKEDLQDLLDPKRTENEVRAQIFKVNPYHGGSMTPEAEKQYKEKQEFINNELARPQGYTWKIAPDATNYNDVTKDVMDKFINIANDPQKLNELVKITGRSKEEIADSMLNVFGELGQENNWTTSRGKGLKSRLENIAESLITSVRLGKGLSVGPGQIKFSELQKEEEAAHAAGQKSLKEQFGIDKPNDLYNIDKVIPLMTAMDLRDRKTLENWGKNNTLSQKLFGWTRPEIIDNEGRHVSGGFNADQLGSETGSQTWNGVGRYTPYLRNQYSSIANNQITTGGDDYIPFNEETTDNFSPSRYNASSEDEMKNTFSRDPGSYAYKVQNNWENNLNRFVNKNDEGKVELQDVVIQGKPRKRKR